MVGIGLVLVALGGCEIDRTGETQTLRSVGLEQGALTLVAPDGFCIDPKTVRRSFALMARCDTLGGDPTGAPLAVITATSVPAKGAELSAADLGRAQEDVLERRNADNVALVQVRGTPPSDAFRNTYWRGGTQIGTRVLGVAIYTPTDAPSLGSTAPALLEQTLTRTRSQSGAVTGNSATPEANTVQLGFIDRLFQ